MKLSGLLNFALVLFLESKGLYYLKIDDVHCKTGKTLTKKAKIAYNRRKANCIVSDFQV